MKPVHENEKPDGVSVNVSIVIGPSERTGQVRAAVESVRNQRIRPQRLVVLTCSTDGMAETGPAGPDFATGIRVENLDDACGQINRMLEKDDNGIFCWLPEGVCLAPDALQAFEQCRQAGDANEAGAWLGELTVATPNGVVLSVEAPADESLVFDVDENQSDAGLRLRGAFTAFFKADALRRAGGFMAGAGLLAGVEPLFRVRKLAAVRQTKVPFFRGVSDESGSAGLSLEMLADWTGLAVREGRRDAVVRVLKERSAREGEQARKSVTAGEVVARQGERAVSRCLSTRTLLEQGFCRVSLAVTAKMRKTAGHLVSACRTGARPAPKPKLGVSFTVFDGVELLEYAIRQIRPAVDFLDVAWQEVSWFGKKIKDEDRETLQRLRREGLIDSLHCVTDVQIVSRERDGEQAVIVSKRQETAKRQGGLDRSVLAGCTHFLSLDVDDFYHTDEFRRAWDAIRKDGHDFTACWEVRYVRLPVFQKVQPPGQRAMVPFIARVDRHTKIGRPNFFVGVDPTKSFDSRGGKNRFFELHEVCDHHMELVRKDLRRKYESSTMHRLDFSKFGDLEKSWRGVAAGASFDYQGAVANLAGGVPVTVVPNWFNIPVEMFMDNGEEGMKAQG